MNWWFIGILISSGLGLLLTFMNKKLKLKSKVAGTVGYILYMVLIAMAINRGW